MNQSNTYIVIDNVSVDDVGNVGNLHRIDQTTALKPKVNYLDYSTFQCNTTNIYKTKGDAENIRTYRQIINCSLNKLEKFECILCLY